jgi:hypothetical protein
MRCTDRHYTCLLAAAGLLLGASAALAANPGETRKPVGAYIHFVVDEALHKKQDIKTELTGLLGDPLLKQFIQGVAAGERWSTIHKSAPKCASLPTCTDYSSGFDWKPLEDVFDAAKATGKTVQLIITPGMDAPQWVKDKLAPCDALFASPIPVPSPKPGPDPIAPLPTVGQDCGSAAFVDFPEAKRADKDKNGDFALPMPWNTEYQEAWAYFLRALNDHFKANPQFVAIAVAGPITASDEFIMPTSLNNSKTKVGGLPADEAWTRLIKNAFPKEPAEYWTSNQAFIDAWQRTIEKYQSIFSGLTLFLGPDAANDWPTFGQTQAKEHKEEKALDLYDIDCSQAVIGGKNYKVSCEAKTQVIALFLDSKGPNQKATQVGGLKGASSIEPGNIGVAGVKILTAANPPHWTAPLAIGGAEFDHAVSHPKDGVGCLGKQGKCDLSPEDAATNVLHAFFANTPVGEDYPDAGEHNGVKGSQKIYYLDVPLADVEYMKKNRCNTPRGTGTPLAQQIAKANQEMFRMASEMPPPPLACDVGGGSGDNTASEQTGKGKQRKAAAAAADSDDTSRPGRRKKQ